MPPKFFNVKNFEKYQHYKQRNPPWIKLYYELLDDDNFISMSIASRHHYIMLLLIAGRKNNLILNDMSYLRKVMRLDTEPDLTELIDSGFLLASRRRPAIILKGNCKQNALTETEDIPEDIPEDIIKIAAVIESSSPQMERAAMFWNSYKPNPRKVGRGSVEKWFEKNAVSDEVLASMLTRLQGLAVSDKWLEEGGRYIPAPMTWLNQKRWLDDVPLSRKKDRIPV